MSQENDKTIDVPTTLVVKKSPDCKVVAHKAKAGLSEAQAIERHTVGNFGDNEEESDES